MDRSDRVAEETSSGLSDQLSVRTYARRGLLALAGLRACAEVGHRVVVVLGQADYYPRLGFSAQLAGRLKAAVSGHGNEADVRRCEEAGIDCHFLKPVGPAELEKALGKAERIPAN
jgi:hypothetical protein